MRRLITFIGLIALVLGSISGIAFAENELNGKYFTLKDQRGLVITRTAHQVFMGDEYLNSRNQLYKVVKIQNNTALVKLVRTEKLSAALSMQWHQIWKNLISLDFLKGEVRQRGPIGIYHTHSDESYIPGDGISSKRGRGGIFQVGDSLTRAFEENGIPVVHSKIPHDPHDASAYDRSRRTAVQLLRNRPSTLIDVHRDSVPPAEYHKVVNNTPITKVQIVVGRQNPNFQANNAFAKQIKASVDRKYPGMIKGIFYGKGKYNQDLGPRSILLEFGADKNSKGSAERGARIFAAAAKDVVYGASGAGFINRGSIRSLFLIVAAFVGGVGLFLLMNRRGLKNIGKEFTGAIGETESNKDKDQKGEDETNQPGNNGESS